jgi:hypothetical protein
MFVTSGITTSMRTPFRNCEFEPGEHAQRMMLFLTIHGTSRLPRHMPHERAEDCHRNGGGADDDLQELQPDTSDQLRTRHRKVDEQPPLKPAAKDPANGRTDRLQRVDFPARASVILPMQDFSQSELGF